MLLEIAIIASIYIIWLVTLVNMMVSSEEISLTITTLPFIITFPVALVLSATVEIYIPGFLLVDILLTVIIVVLVFSRWIMAIVSA
ncbi:hypothetical protein EU537_10165 [Candidatus Thorarchaeota archaeon]|nr:MAG: hypothetical protein EU537_10165 [Candidatus Thorarchaeota archaeon]